MEPIGPLMKEHRRIERMVELLDHHSDAVKAGRPPNDELLCAAVGFFRMYADRTHHGKEEDILFAALSERDLSDDHRGIMDELIDEHEQARELVGKLESAEKEMAANGDEARQKLRTTLDQLVELYLPHIDKEDNRFFRPAMEYFSEEERQTMLEQFQEFDAGMIHEAYEKTVSRFEQGG